MVTTEISTKMLKILGSSVCKLLQITYKTCLEREGFPREEKKASVVPVRNKNDKQLVKCYSLFPCHLRVAKVVNVYSERLMI